MKTSKYSAPLIVFIISVCILVICYPGFMSYDSIRMLEEARTSVRGGIYPTMPVYILRVFDIFGHGSTLMLQIQNYTLLLGLMLILRTLGASLIASMVSLLGLLLFPTVIGCMLVLWKDVTLTALMVCSVALIYWASQVEKNTRYLNLAKWLSLLLLVLGTLVRFRVVWMLLFFLCGTLRDVG